MKDIRIAVRVTAKEKDKIQSKARKSGLSTTEYVKQRALGYEPRGIPPDALFACLEKLGELADKVSSPELDSLISTFSKSDDSDGCDGFLLYNGFIVIAVIAVILF